VSGVGLQIVIGAEGFEEAFGGDVEAVGVGAGEDVFEGCLVGDKEVEIGREVALVVAELLDDEFAGDSDVMGEEVFRQAVAEVGTRPFDADVDGVGASDGASEGDVVGVEGAGGPAGVGA